MNHRDTEAQRRIKKRTPRTCLSSCLLCASVSLWFISSERSKASAPHGDDALVLPTPAAPATVDLLAPTTYRRRCNVSLPRLARHFAWCLPILLVPLLWADEVDDKYPLDPQLKVLARDVESPRYRQLVLETMLSTDLAAEWQRVATADNADSFLARHG